MMKGDILNKSVREAAEENEKIILSPYASLACNSLGRDREEPECEIRTCYQRDRDRIIHCKAFRRLKHKTQVFLAPEGDYYRTRLTHTLEVSQIARTIARALKLNEDLTEACALGHDLGHTPFGHAGERAINDLSGIRFNHNEQSVRVVDKIEKGGKGLNLTKEVKNGILCHTNGEEAFTLEGRIIRIADKIAYINHDIDDAVSAGVIRKEDLPPEFTDVLGKSKSQRINRLVLDVVENSEKEIAQSDEIKKAFSGLCEFMFKNVYNSLVCRKEDEKAYCIIEKLYLYYISNIDELPAGYLSIAENEGSERAVCDYIAGMSDTFALRKYNELFIPEILLG